MESKHILKSIEVHRQRFSDHRNDFIAQEAKLLQWGLKHVLRNLHQYFWSRITRSLLVKDLTCELYRSVSITDDDTTSRCVCVSLYNLQLHVL